MPLAAKLSNHSYSYICNPRKFQSRKLILHFHLKKRIHLSLLLHTKMWRGLFISYGQKHACEQADVLSSVFVDWQETHGVVYPHSYQVCVCVCACVCMCVWGCVCVCVCVTRCISYQTDQYTEYVAGKNLHCQTICIKMMNHDSSFHIVGSVAMFTFNPWL